MKQLFGNKAYNVALTADDLVVAPTYSEVQELHELLGFPWFTAPFDLNFGGIRNDEEEKSSVDGNEDEVLLLHENVFNDVIYLAWTDSQGEQYIKLWKGTTDPGFYWRQKPGRGTTKRGVVRGVGAIREGHHSQIYYPGMHGSRPALQQEQKPVLVYRDNNLDKVLELDAKKTAKGWGFRFHYMGKHLEFVNKWSGGCNGSNDPGCVPFVLEMVQRQADEGHGSHVSYNMVRSSWFRDADFAKEDYEVISGYEVGKGI